MDFLWQLFRTTAPLLVTSTGVLVSEYAGVMTIFADGFISFGGFLSYCFMVQTGSPFVSVFFSTAICTVLGYGAAFVTQKLRANPFLTGLALNIAVTGIISFLSVVFFGTRGVLASSQYNLPEGAVSGMVWCAWFLSLLVVLMLVFTKAGTYIRITGSAPEVMKVRGLSPERWKAVSWAIAAFCAAFAGNLLSIHLGSFVPHLSAGRGWTALAAVFLGRKKVYGVFLGVLVFGLAEYVGNNVQRIAFFENVPSALLLTLPYIAALLLIGGSKSQKTTE